MTVCGVGTKFSLPHDRASAADQPRQLLEPAADAVGDEIDHAVLEHQHQLAAAAAEMRRGQHAGARRRNQMRDAERRAETLSVGEFVALARLLS
mgnify:CR=1 FL=1